MDHRTAYRNVEALLAQAAHAVPLDAPLFRNQIEMLRQEAIERQRLQPRIDARKRELVR